MDRHVRWPPDRYEREWYETSAIPWLLFSIAIAAGVPALSIVAEGFYLRWIDNETTGLQEIAHAALPIACIVIAGRLLTKSIVRRDRLMAGWLVAITLGCFYLAGEEVSWGQHFFGWGTPEGIARLNDQEETNLHNISSWLDQRPRSILKVGIYLGTLVLPLVWMERSTWLPQRWGPSYPPLHLWPLAAGLLLTDLAGDYVLPLIYDEGTSAPWRDGEVEETFIVLFMLGYMLTLRRRIRSLEDKERNRVARAAPV